MSHYLTDGWLLHKKPQGDTSWQLTIFTKEFGKIDALFRGGRVAKKNSSVQFFTSFACSLNRAYQRFYINQLDLLEPACFLQNEALYCGWYINELLTYVLPVEYQAVALFDYYKITLHALEHHKTRLDLAKALRKFERMLIITAGFAWWNSNNIAYDNNKKYNYIHNEGFMLANDGIFSGSTIISIINDNWDNPETIKQAKILFKIILDDLLNGRELQSKKLWLQHF